jgi:hypothetical protein
MLGTSSSDGNAGYPTLFCLDREAERKSVMPYFAEIQPFFDCIEELFCRLSQDKNVKVKALASKLIVCFKFRDPDVAHRFWLGKLNLVKSLTSGEIESDGSVPRMLKLLPVIKPAFNI